MKDFLKLLGITIALFATLFVLTQVAFAAQTAVSTNNGGTGTTTWQTSSIPYFNGTRFTELNGSFSFNGTKATITYASTTETDAATFCLTGDTCRTTWPSGAWPFTPATNFGSPAQSTSTALWDTAGLQASSTSQFVSLNVWSVLNLHATSSALLATDASGNVVSTSTIGTNLLSANTISGVALGGTLNSLSHDSTLSGTSYNGSAAVSNWGLNIANPNWWTARQNFTNASTSQLTATSSVWFTSLGVSAGTFLAVDPNGLLIATTTPINTGGSTEGVQWATAAVLAGTPTYVNGTGGVGATLTEVGNGALSVDGGAPAANNRVLVKNQASAFQNGIYTVTAPGSAIAVYVLTRATDYNTPTEITPGISTYVVSGTANTDTTWAVSYTSPLTIGTTNLTYTKVSGGGAAVSSVSNSDGTLTISPTTGAVVASIALAHANTWTGLQTFSNATSTLFSSATIWDSTVGAALWLGDSNGKATAYAGSTCTNQFVRSLNGAGVATCSAVSLTADVSGTLPIANGGTNTNSFNTTNGITAYNGTSLVNFAGYTLSSTLLTATNASTTNFSVNGNEVSGQRYLTMLDSTSTTWTATSSNAQIIAPFKGTLSSVQCSTATSSTDTTGTYTLNIQFKDGSTNITPMFNASTTKGTVAFTGSNTFNAGNTIEMDAGTPANSPTRVSCTAIATGF